jgi:hypothetical protein
MIAFGGVAARAAAASGIPRAKFPIPAQAMNRIGGLPRLERVMPCGERPGDQSLRHFWDAANAKRKPPRWQTSDT